MNIDLIFKIAAIGIIVAVLNQLLSVPAGGTGNDDHISWTDCGSDDDYPGN